MGGFVGSYDRRVLTLTSFRQVCREVAPSLSPVLCRVKRGDRQSRKPVVVTSQRPLIIVRCYTKFWTSRFSGTVRRSGPTGPVSPVGAESWTSPSVGHSPTWSRCQDRTPGRPGREGRAGGQGGDDRAAAAPSARACPVAMWPGVATSPICSVKVTYPDARSQSLVLHVLVTLFRILSVH